MENVFVDTDIILDVLAERRPHYDHAAVLFSLADSGLLQIHISALTIANLNYILKGTFTTAQAHKKLLQFKTLVTVLPLKDKVFDLALASEFIDLEDGLQYFTAIEHHIPTLITRNLKDYKAARIPVLTAEQYLKGTLLKE